MKPETVNRMAFDLTQNRKIAARIAELRAIAADKACVSAARVLEEVARIGLFDPADIFDADGKLLPIHKMPPKARAAISYIEVEEIGIQGVVIGSLKKIKICDKNSSLEKLMKHLGMFEKDNKQKSDPLRDLLKEIDGTTASLLPDGKIIN